jgi:hypothetical protein
MADEYPAAEGQARFLVQDVRAGSIIATLTPYWPVGVGASVALAGVMTAVGYANDLADFVNHCGSVIRRFAKPGGRKGDATKSELGDFGKMLGVIAHDANGSLSMASYTDGQKTAKFHFDTRQARIAEKNIEEQRAEMDAPADADFKRVLMRFTRTDRAHARAGKRTGERVEISTLYPKSLPIVYASSLAEERVRHEIAEADDNVYKKAFDVDVNVEYIGDRPVAYRVVAVHDVIDLPDESDDSRGPNDLFGPGSVDL